MTTRITRHAILPAVLAVLAVLAGACAPRRPAAPVPIPAPAAPAAPVPVVRAPIPDVNPNLPPVPHVTGPLEIKVVYPPAGHLIQSRDSNFIFGSVGNGDAGLTINGVSTPVWANGAFMGWLPVPSARLSRYDIVATAGTETVQLSHPIKLLPPPAPAPGPADTIDVLFPARYAALIGPAAAPSDTDRVVSVYELKKEDPRWLLLPGTVLKVHGLQRTDAHVELGDRAARIPGSAVTMLPPTYAPVALVAKAFRVVTAPDWVDIEIPVNQRPAFLVEEAESSLTLTLYSTSGVGRSSSPGAASGYVTAAQADVAGQDLRYTISLRGPVYGYLPLWQDSAFTLRIRRPPPIDATNPLRGLTIAIDPGHPPVGATGPTGLYEAIPTLAVGLRVQALLQARGVNVVMTRTTPDPVPLYDRPTMARRANAHALVSIHLNALPDGRNPHRDRGTTTYYFHAHAKALAETTHRALLSEMGLPDKGVRRGSLVLTRPTWMPAVLAEGAFIMMPDQEAAIRTPEYQECYARGIVEGLDHYFRSLGQATR